MAWRVEYLDAFYDSLAELDDSDETQQAVNALLHEATMHPEASPPLSGVIRVYKILPRDGFPPLRLFYWLDDETIRIARVDYCDETTH